MFGQFAQRLGVNLRPDQSAGVGIGNQFGLGIVKLGPGALSNFKLLLRSGCIDAISGMTSVSFLLQFTVPRTASSMACRI